MRSRWGVAVVVVGLAGVAASGRTVQGQETKQVAALGAAPAVPAGAVAGGSEVTAPELIYSVDPDFRAKGLQRHFDGSCALAFTVGADGRPEDIHVVQSMGAGKPGMPQTEAAELDRNAMEAVRQYRFTPARSAGRAVAVEVRVEVDLHVI